MQQALKLLINGLPGNMATEVVRLASTMTDIIIIPASFTGPEITGDIFEYNLRHIKLIKPNSREEYMGTIPKNSAHSQEMVALDFTHPTATAENIRFYCDHNIPFVMGTTGVDMKAAKEMVRSSSICAVIAPNMSRQVVALQAAMEFMAMNFPGAFERFEAQIVESHQKGKADTSGTAKAMISYFQKLGIPITAEEIIKIRDPKEQLKMGIPESALRGHGWHTYRLNSKNASAEFVITHNINGRTTYAEGAIAAARFLHKKMTLDFIGATYSMIDVLGND